MMKLKILIVIVMGLGVFQSAEAQLLKKLKKKAEQAVERTVLKKTDSLVAKKTEKTIDGATTKKDSTKTDSITSGKGDPEKDAALEKKMGKIFGTSLEGVPDSYKFSYVVTFQIKTGKDELPFQYFLEPNAHYFANKTQAEGATTMQVYDLKKNYMVTFMDNGQQKMAMKMKLPNMKKVQEKYGNRIFTDKEQKNVQVTPIESKKILGFNCLGFKVTTNEGEGKIWITNDAPVSLNQVYSNLKKLKESDPYANLPINEKTLIMEMQFQSSKNRKDNMHMLCTELIEEHFNINKKDYKSGM